MKRRHSRLQLARSRERPGYLFLIVAIAALVLVSARFMGVTPSDMIQGVSLPFFAPGAGERDVIDVSGRGESGTPVARATPRVLIYHAHASENYAPKPTHASGGAPGDVVEVGRELAARLEELGIRTIHVTGIYDDPWKDAYTKSAQAVRQVLQANPGIELVLDIHRDAVENRQAGIATLQAGAERTAKILFTVGEVNNPNLQSNAETAARLKDELERRYPGISRGMRISQHEANGHLHAQAVEVHIGDYNDSTLEEAKAAARRLAEAVAALLN